MRFIVFILLFICGVVKSQPSMFNATLSQCQVVTSGLVLYVDANKSASQYGNNYWYDLKGGNNAAATNSPTFTHTGTNGGYITFDGSSNYFEFTAPYNTTTNDFTVSVWLKTNSTPSVNVVAFGNYPPYGAFTTNNYQLYLLTTGKCISQIRDGSAISILDTSTNVINDNVWHNVVFMRSGTTQNLYVDGVFNMSHSNVLLGNINTSGNTMDLGRQSSFSGNYFPGSIANCLLYSRALTATEVSQNYNAFYYQYSH